MGGYYHKIMKSSRSCPLNLKICTKQGFVTFVIDDAHYMDTDSWTYIQDLGKDARALVVLTYKPKRAGAIFPNVAEEALGQPTTRKVTLHGLQPEYIAPLACQLLKVHEIPMRLNKYVTSGSGCFDFWHYLPIRKPKVVWHSC